jgi:hypothetical protein
MKKMKLLHFAFILNLILMMIFTGCASRQQEAVIAADSTFVYLPKKSDDISAKITFYRKLSKKTGQPLDAATSFAISKKESVRALVELENRFAIPGRELMFHLDWVGPDGSSFYLKPINLAANDSSAMLNSGISVSPETRQPGEYLLRVYYFRELIAEKKFALLPEIPDSILALTKITAKITFCKKVDKKTGKRIDVDTVFTTGKKGWVNAFVDVENRFAVADDELKFKLDWIGPADTSVYRKIITLSPGDSTTTLTNSMSVSPETRQPGNYLLRVYLSGEPLAEKKFVLIPEPKLLPPPAIKLTAYISFCRGFDKTTGERNGVDSVFSIAKKGRIHAFADIENRAVYADKTLKFDLEWVDPDGKSFYRKQTELLPDDSAISINSSISVSPETRQPGIYFFNIYLSDKLVGKGKFEMVP